MFALGGRVALALLLAGAAVAQPSCPNSCSSVGLCDAIGATCACFPGYTASPDCSRRSCPEGPGWALRLSGPGDSPHTQLVQCSGAGKCDTSRGVCVCVDGFGGAACERSLCPSSSSSSSSLSSSVAVASNGSSSSTTTTTFASSSAVCNGRGRCLPASPDLQRAIARTRPLPSSSLYTGWDAGRIFACACDPGFGGPDCSLTFCPAADNPLTLGQQRRLVQVRFDVPASLALASRRLRFVFAGAESDPINIDALAASGTPQECAAAFSTGRTLDGAQTRCRLVGPGMLSSVDGGGMLGPGGYEALLALSFPLDTAWTNLMQHDGEPPASLFGCYLDPSIPEPASTCSVTLLDPLRMEAVPPTPSLPDGTTYTVAVSDSTTFPNKVTVTKRIAGSPPILTTLPPISMTTASSGVEVGSGEGVFLRWETLWGHERSATWTLGTTGLAVNALTSPTYREYALCAGNGLCNLGTGTCACPAGLTTGKGCEVAPSVSVPADDADPSLPLLNVHAQAADFQGSILSLTSSRPLSSGFNFLSASDRTEDANSPPAFAVRGDGSVSARSLDISSGAVIEPRLQIAMPWATVPSFNTVPVLSVYYGSSTTVPGLGAAGASATAAITSEFPADNVLSATYNIFRVSARATASVTDRASLLSVRGDGRTTVEKGLTVNSGGLSIHSGGVSVTAGGLLVAAGVTSLQGGLSVSGAAAVRSGGISIVGGTRADTLDVSGTAAIGGLLTLAGGADITAGGLAVDAGGLYVGTGGMSLSAGGAIFTSGGVSVNAGGLWAADAAGASTTAAARLGGGGNGAGGAASFAVTSGATGYTGDVIYVEGPPSSATPGAYNLLRLTSATTSLVVSRGGDLLSGDTFVLQSAATTGTTVSGDISLVVGAAAGAAGGKVAIVAGSGGGAGAGGDLSFRAGEGSGTGAGGHAFLVAGSGAAGGGNVILQPGLDTSVNGLHGEVVIKDASSVTRMRVTGDGDIIFAPAAGGAASLTSSSAPIVTSATVLSLTASTAVVARGLDGTGGNDGGSLSFFGGNAAASAGAGSIFLRPGSSVSGAAGTIRMHSATLGGAPTYPLRIELTNAATTIFSDAQTAAFTVTHGATAAASSATVAGTLTAGGVTTLAGGAGVGTSLLVGGWAQTTGALSVAGAVWVGGAASIAGATSLAGTVQVGDALTVAANGATIAGGLSVTGGTGLAVGGAGGSVSASVGFITNGFASVHGVTTLAGATRIASALTISSGGLDVTGSALISGSTSLGGSLSVGANAAVAGFVSVQGATTLSGTVSAGGLVTLTQGLAVAGGGSLYVGGGGSIFAAGAGGAVSVGGSLVSGGILSVNGATTLAGALAALGPVTASQGADVTGSLTVTNGGLQLITAGQLLQANGAMSIGGAASVSGNIVAAGNVLLSGGSLSVGAATGGIVGAPVLVQGAAGAAANAAGSGVSLFGGAGGSGAAGGDVVIQPGAAGASGGTEGVLRLRDGAGATQLSATAAGVAVAGSLTVSDATKTVSIAGTLSAGWLGASTIVLCDAAAWGGGGACNALTSADPSTATKVRIHWNADFAAGHTVTYAGALGAVTVAAGALFPVYFA
jgi:hypothetical protein